MQQHKNQETCERKNRLQASPLLYELDDTWIVKYSYSQLKAVLLFAFNLSKVVVFRYVCICLAIGLLVYWVRGQKAEGEIGGHMGAPPPVFSLARQWAPVGLLESSS